MNDTYPVISVIMPCYNQAQYLHDALLSLIAQDYPHWECIIVNDESPDNTEEVALQWVNKDKRIKYFYKENSGVCDTRNCAVEQAVGEYILPLDADDKLGAQYLSQAMAVFRQNRNVKLVYSDAILFGERNEKIIYKEFDFEKMLTENLISNSAIFRKSDFIESGGYNPNMVYGIEDWDFYLSLIKPSDIVIKLNAFHCYYRTKGDSRSIAVNEDKERNNAMLLRMFKNHIPLFLDYFNPVMDHLEAEVYKKELQWHYNTKEYRFGRAIFAPYNRLKRLYHKIISQKG